MAQRLSEHWKPSVTNEDFINTQQQFQQKNCNRREENSVTKTITHIYLEKSGLICVICENNKFAAQTSNQIRTKKVTKNIL